MDEMRNKKKKPWQLKGNWSENKLNMLTNTIFSTFVSHQAMDVHPDKYLGETSRCKGFLSQCSMYFSTPEGVVDQQKVV